MVDDNEMDKVKSDIQIREKEKNTTGAVIRSKRKMQ